MQRSLTRATIGATRILALALCCWALPGWAEPPKSISLELNKLEQEGGSCRAYLVIANRGTDAFSESFAGSSMMIGTRSLRAFTCCP